MTLYGNSKRTHTRFKRELKVDVKTGTQTVQVYSIDFSALGIKLAGIMLKLSAGDQVELTLEKDGEKFTFRGRVERDDGAEHVNRINREANAYFIRILDAGFSEFVKATFA